MISRRPVNGIKKSNGFLFISKFVYMTHVAPFICYFIFVSWFLKEVTQGKALKDLF